jgi:hypothetical protein
MHASLPAWCDALLAGGMGDHSALVALTFVFAVDAVVLFPDGSHSSPMYTRRPIILLKWQPGHWSYADVVRNVP